MSRIAPALALAVVLGAVEAGAQPLVVTGTHRQLIADPAEQIQPRISGDRVVFTDQRNDVGDIYVVDVTTGAEVHIASSPRPERLNDISGHRVVFTEFNAPERRVAIHDLTTGVTTYPSPSTADQNPQIDGPLAAWERNLGNLANVVVFDVDSNTEVVIDFGGPGINPAPDGTRVVFEARVNAASPADIYLYDTVTQAIVQLSSGPEDDRRPSIDGDIVAWESATGGTGIAVMIHRLSTGVTWRLPWPGVIRAPQVSGRFVTFDEILPGDFNVGLYSVDADEAMLITTGPSIDWLSHIDANRVVYMGGDSNGNNDIWVYEFLVEPLQSIAPAAGLAFGAVPVGQNAVENVTVSHPQNRPVTVLEVTIVGVAAADFTTTLPVPSAIAVGEPLAIAVAFAPTTSGLRSAVLRVVTDLGTLEVPLAGSGTAVVAPPGQQIDDLIAFFTASVAAGTLTGTESGPLAGARLLAYRVALEAVRLAIAAGWNNLAIQLLGAAALRADGAAPPPDLVTGPATAELLQRIAALQSALAGS